MNIYRCIKIHKKENGINIKENKLFQNSGILNTQDFIITV